MKLVKRTLVGLAFFFAVAQLHAESRTVLVVVKQEKDKKASVTIYSDEKKEQKSAVAVDEAAKVIGEMKGWGSAVGVYVTSDRGVARADVKKLLDAINDNLWLELQYFGREVPKIVADHFLKTARDVNFLPGVRPSELKVELAPGTKIVGKGRLELPVKVTNNSPRDIKTTLQGLPGRPAFGGIWPPTDLYAWVAAATGPKDTPFQSVYLAGENLKGEAITIAAGASKDLMLWMNWRGTASVPNRPIIEAPGNYIVQVLLLFEVSGKRQYVMSPPTTVELLAAEPNFDAVLRLERPGQKPVLYFVLTPKEKALEKQLAVVGEHLDVALKTVEAGKDADISVIFFLRHGPESLKGSSSGFTCDQLKKIAALPADQRAAKLLEHHWMSIAELPKDAKPVDGKPAPAGPRPADEKSPPAQAAPAPDLSRFPKLEGKVKHVLGVNLDSFIPPEVGDPFQLDLKEVLKATQLSFDPAKMSYIPLPGPVAVDSIHYYTNGAFQSMRLVAKQDPKLSSRKVTIDIQPAPGTDREPSTVLVWVIVEWDIVHGVAVLEGKYEGAFPNRPVPGVPK